jgi:ABC-type Co2+ transport system permease subunit
LRRLASSSLKLLVVVRSSLHFLNAGYLDILLGYGKKINISLIIQP